MSRRTPARLLSSTLLLLPLVACSGPDYERGSDDPSIDERAMSTRLDRADLERALDEWYAAFEQSPFVTGLGAARPSISVLEITNETSEHISSALSALITSVETHLVNSNKLDVVANDELVKAAIAQELMAGDEVDPDTMAEAGKRLGVHYFVHGSVGDTTEKTDDRRRVQYYLFLKVTEVETRRIVFQHQSDVTKQITD